jgi:hypothetical protein
MPVRYFPLQSSLDFLQEELTYTYAKVLAHPATQAIAPGAKSLLDEWQDLRMQEVSLRTKKMRAVADEEIADEALNDLVDVVVHHLGGLDPGQRAPLAHLLLHGAPPSIFKRPVLGRQLEQMRAWPGILQGESMPAPLRALAPQVEACVAAADTVAGAKESATQDLRQFRLVGKRCQFVEKINRWRQETCGELDKLAARDASLPRNFSGRFFMNSSQTEATLSREAELEQLAGRIEETRGLLGTLEARQQELWAEKTKQEAAQEEARALQEELDEAERKASELRARLRKR